MSLAEVVYRLTEEFPKREWYCLALEMRRSAVSIPSNLAEGHSQGHRAYIRHLVIAIGSHSELRSQGELATRLNYINAEARKDLDGLLGEVGRLCQALLRSLRPVS